MRKARGIQIAASAIGLLVSSTIAQASLPEGSLYDYIPSIVYNSEDGSLLLDTGVGYGGPGTIYNVYVSSDYGIFDPYRAGDVVGYATDYYISTITGWDLGDGEVLGEPDFMYDNESKSFLLNDLTFVFQVDPFGTVYGGDLVYYTPIPDLPGDQNGDGYVGLDDLDIVLGSWNSSVPPGDARADVNGDGYVGLDDLDIVLNNWNTGTPPVQAVPEPATAGLIALMLGTGLVRRSR